MIEELQILKITYNLRNLVTIILVFVIDFLIDLWNLYLVIISLLPLYFCDNIGVISTRLYIIETSPFIMQTMNSFFLSFSYINSKIRQPTILIHLLKI